MGDAPSGKSSQTPVLGRFWSITLPYSYRHARGMTQTAARAKPCDSGTPGTRFQPTHERLGARTTSCTSRKGSSQPATTVKGVR